MMYTDSTATKFHHAAESVPSPATIIDIGEVSGDVARWLAAILAPGEGWKAIVSRRDDGEYLAPWSVCRKDTHCITIKWRRDVKSSSVTGSTLPPSRMAFEHLSRFSLLHNLGSQFLVALATVMTFPTHNYHASVVHLPLPTETRAEEEEILRTSTLPEWTTISDELPYYMALSWNSEVVMSSLCGGFWDADVPCNLVSLWLHPILNEVPEGKQIIETPSLYYEIIAIICGLRRP